MLHDKELCDLYIVRIVKSRRLIWAAHVARMEETKNAY